MSVTMCGPVAVYWQPWYTARTLALAPVPSAWHHDSMNTNPDKKRRFPRSGIYLLPNLLTTAALFAGFYSVVAAMDGDFVKAAIGIFVAMVLDGLDGRVARMTGTDSDFGKEYDSLCDMVSFGLAPALVVYQWGLVNAALTYSSSRIRRNSARVKRAVAGQLTMPMARAMVASDGVNTATKTIAKINGGNT